MSGVGVTTLVCTDTPTPYPSTLGDNEIHVQGAGFDVCTMQNRACQITQEENLLVSTSVFWFWLHAWLTATSCCIDKWLPIVWWIRNQWLRTEDIKNGRPKDLNTTLTYWRRSDTISSCLYLTWTMILFDWICWRRNRRWVCQRLHTVKSLVLW